jgi:hypothetical protein
MAHELRRARRGKSSGGGGASIEFSIRLTNGGRFMEDGARGKMSFRRVLTAGLALSAVVMLAAAAAKGQADSGSKDKAPPTKTDQMSRVTIEVSGGESDAPIENASIYVKYVEERKILKDKKVELNVKTNRDGVAHIPAAPLGRVLIQVVADGWKTYGRWYDITEARQTFKLHLEKPPKWY